MKSLAEVLRVIEEIPEPMCGGMQPHVLYTMATQTKGLGAVVEIGTCAGKSAIALGYGRQSTGRAPIHSIDIVEHPSLRDNLHRAGVEDFVRCSLLGSERSARDWLEPIELLWIDGDHSYNGVLRDIRAWAHHVVPGGVLAFHDYPAPGGDSLGDVGRAVYQTILARPDRWRVGFPSAA